MSASETSPSNTNNNSPSNSDQSSAPQAVSHSGSCHCGAVRFEAVLDLTAPGSRCNCSVCAKLGATGAIVKPVAFRLLAGSDSLFGYQWGAKVSTRYFCKVCGIFVYGQGHLAEVGGDFVSLNLNCLDEVDVNQLPVIHWDGRNNNWQAGPRPTPWPRRVAVAQAA